MRTPYDRAMDAWLESGETAMLKREPITEDWRTWDSDRLAWALEAHLIPFKRWEEHVAPDELRAYLSDPRTGLGHTALTGYFVLASAGQGPIIVGIENESNENRGS